MYSLGNEVTIFCGISTACSDPPRAIRCCIIRVAMFFCLLIVVRILLGIEGAWGSGVATSLPLSSAATALCPISRNIALISPPECSVKVSVEPGWTDKKSVRSKKLFS